MLVDAFNTLVLARRTRHVFRIARLYYQITWTPFAALARRIKSPLRRESLLGIFGPLSLLLLIVLWGVGLTLSFGLLEWSVGMESAQLGSTFAHDLYLSARTLVSLNDGDPTNAASRFLSVCEAGLGLTFLGLVVGYLPVLYQSFAKRELLISILDAHAGSPPSAGGLLATTPFEAKGVIERLERWESWMAQLLENQISFPMLGYFRSQHANQAWLTALVAMVDYAMIVSIASNDSLRLQANLTAAMGRHVLSDVVVIFGQEQSCDGTCSARLSAKAEQLRGLLLNRAAIFDANRLSGASLEEKSTSYEPQARALSEYFLMSLPGAIPDGAVRGDWRVSILDRDEAPFAVSDPFQN
uniref:K+ channel, pore region n=1 Tax=Solibacter usitatus (strain Ellin6076) TaxID=234267 RepID=Q01RA5_SOLUE